MPSWHIINGHWCNLKCYVFILQSRFHFRCRVSFVHNLRAWIVCTKPVRTSMLEMSSRKLCIVFRENVVYTLR